MHGLYVLWWVRERHVPVAVVAAILAAGDLVVSALELPTGWLADRRGHRASLIAGSGLQIAGMLAAWLGRGIPGILAASFLIAAGDAFRSGADQALLYRSCAAAGDRSFQRREAHARALQLASLVVLVLAGGAIVNTWGFDAGWLGETLLCAAGLAIACAMVEPPSAIAAPSEENEEHHERECAAANASGGTRMAALMAIVLPTALLIAAASACLFYVQSDMDASPSGMTAAVAIATLAEAAGAFLGARVAASVRTLTLVAGAGVALTAAALLVPAAFYPGLAASFMLMGLSEPLRAAAIQRAAGDRVRARAASLASACDKVLTTATLLMVGMLRRPN